MISREQDFLGENSPWGKNPRIRDPVFVIVNVLYYFIFFYFGTFY